MNSEKLANQLFAAKVFLLRNKNENVLELWRVEFWRTAIVDQLSLYEHWAGIGKICWPSHNERMPKDLCRIRQNIHLKETSCQNIWASPEYILTAKARRWLGVIFWVWSWSYHCYAVRAVADPGSHWRRCFPRFNDYRSRLKYVEACRYAWAEAQPGPDKQMKLKLSHIQIRAMMEPRVSGRSHRSFCTKLIKVYYKKPGSGSFTYRKGTKITTNSTVFNIKVVVKGEYSHNLVVSTFCILLVNPQIFQGKERFSSFKYLYEGRSCLSRNDMLLVSSEQQVAEMGTLHTPNERFGYASP